MSVGFLDRFRKNREDPAVSLLTEAIGEDGFIYEGDEDLVYVFDYKGTGMALDLTEHPFLSVLFTDDAQCRKAYGKGLDELAGLIPVDMGIETEGEGESKSLIMGIPLMNSEESDPVAMRSLLDAIHEKDVRLKALFAPDTL